MKNIIKIFLLSLIGSIPAMAATGTVNGFCTNGGQTVAVSGLNSTTKVQQSYPSCTVTVYASGTTNKATIYSDSSNTPLANPFTATTTGKFIFYADGGTGLDVVINGGTAPNTLPAPFPIYTNIFPSVPNGGGGVDQIIAGSNVTISPTNGVGDVTVNAGAGLSMGITPPIAGQFAQVYATATSIQTGGSSIVCGGMLLSAPAPTGNATVDNQSGQVGNTDCGGGATNNLWGVTWTGFSIPSYINTANITAIYASAVVGFTGQSGSTLLRQLTCTTTPGNIFNIVAAGDAPIITQQINVTSGTLTVANVPVLSCTANVDNSVAHNNFTSLNISSISLLIYYTGTPPPTTDTVNVQVPLVFNQALQTLGIDTSSITGGLSGMTTGQIPIAASATTVTSSKPLAGAGAGITTGPNSGVTAGDLALFTGTGGQITDGLLAGSNIATLTTTQTFSAPKTFASTLTNSSLAAGECVQTGTGGIFTTTGSACGSGGGGGSPGGTNGQIQFNNSGSFGGISTTGTGNVVLATTPTLVTPVIGTATGTSLTLTNSAASGGTLIVNNSSAADVFRGQSSGTTNSSISFSGAFTGLSFAAANAITAGGPLTASGTITSNVGNVVAGLAISAGTTITATSSVKGSAYLTQTTCTSTASPAVCGSSITGIIQIAALVTSLVINSTAITANTGCWFTYDTEGITAPTNIASLISPYISARTVGTSITISIPIAPVANAVNVRFGCLN